MARMARIGDVSLVTSKCYNLSFWSSYREGYDIMRPEQYNAEKLARLLRKQKVATLTQLKKALGTTVDVTVFRKLKKLGYRSSYSHGGSYYTLEEIPQFDARGLWSHRGIHFSARGTLRATLEALVEESDEGSLASELETLLRVSVKEALLQLSKSTRVSRKKVSGLYLYCSWNRRRAKQQVLMRQSREAASSPAESVAVGKDASDELKAAIILFFSLLDEQQRRLYVGLESLKRGRGGDPEIAELLGVGVRTVARGREQLLARDVELDGIRRAGGGRPRLEKKFHRSSTRSKRS